MARLNKWTIVGVAGGAAVLAFVGVRRVARNQARGIPRLRALDSTLDYLKDGYEFIGNRCRETGSDVFQTRLMLHHAICMRGSDAARTFYTPERFTRARAIPIGAATLLQDFGSVQTLDGAAHRHRKAMFLNIVAPGRVERLVELVRDEWRSRFPAWGAPRAAVLDDEVREILCAAVCDWAGVPLREEDLSQRAREFATMIEAAGRIGPKNLQGQFSRSRTEKWARHAIEHIRSGRLEVAPQRAAAVIAHHRDLDGRPLTTRTAAVELINVLRPAVAVGRFVTFAALALHDHPEWRARVRDDDEALDWFVQEVRRFYPFFPAVAGRAAAAFTWQGRQFEKGDWVLVDIYGTHHDPRSWEDPDAFEPERFRDWDEHAFNFIPQGGGSMTEGHRCPGEGTTIALMKTCVRELTSMSYDVPAQDLKVSLATIPARPASGFMIANAAPEPIAVRVPA